MIFGNGMKLYRINIHLSHCGVCIFSVRALKFSNVYYTSLYHKKRNKILHLTDLFVPVSLTREVFEPLQAVRYLKKNSLSIGVDNGGLCLPGIGFIPYLTWS